MFKEKAIVVSKADKNKPLLILARNLFHPPPKRKKNRSKHPNDFVCPLPLGKFAKKMKNNPTQAERILYKELKPYGFLPQIPIAPFIVDFLNVKTRLVVEVDGEYHNTEKQKKLDFKRDNYLRYRRYTVIRVSNNDVYQNLEYIVRRILQTK